MNKLFLFEFNEGNSLFGVFNGHNSDFIPKYLSKEAVSLLEQLFIGDLLLVNRTGMRVIAIRRGVSWIYGPDKHTTLLADDTLILKGTDEGADLLEKLAAGTCSLEDIPEELEDED